MNLEPGLTVWDYLDTIYEEHPDTRDRINKVRESGDEELANQLLATVWSWFENK